MMSVKPYSGREYGELYLPVDIAKEMQVGRSLVVAPARNSALLGGQDLAFGITPYKHNPNFGGTYQIPILESTGELKKDELLVWQDSYPNRVVYINETPVTTNAQVDIYTKYPQRNRIIHSHPMELPASLNFFYNSLRNQL